MNINFINYNGIKGYAKVMYNDVKDADKYKIEVAYNGKDIKDLLEYLFKLESKIDKINQYIKETRESDSFTELPSGKITDIGYCLVALEDIEDILKEDK